jgi:ATP-dependent DNA helicase RecQ
MIGSPTGGARPRRGSRTDRGFRRTSRDDPEYLGRMPETPDVDRLRDARAVLTERFGFQDFRAGQPEIVEALLGSGRALAVLPTGGGKSICYQLPALLLDGVTLVVSPLIALMKDQIDFLRSRGIEAARLDSSLDADEMRAITNAMTEGKLRLLYVAPERFVNERFIGMLRRTKIALFAVDEAHCISEWGHNFRPDYLKLAEIARSLEVERILALTATATPDVVRDICAAFAIRPEHAIVTSFFRATLAITITPVTAKQRDARLVERLRERPAGSTIVYVTLQRTAERVAADLRKAGFDADAYHAGMEAEARTVVQDRWRASDRHIVVATIAFGMGIDKSDVRYVYHYNLPKSLESYSQEIGRAGRDGLPSVVELFASRDDVSVLESFAYGDTPTREALAGVVRDMVSEPGERAFNLSTLSDRHDVRPLVLRTALTYLELAGVVRQGTPFYAGYKLRFVRPQDEVLAAFTGEPQKFLRRVLAAGKKARIWMSIDPEIIARETGAPRARIVRALEVCEERGLVELVSSDLRHRYERTRDDHDAVALARDLEGRFARREAAEIERIAQVLALVEHSGCHANALVAHFGEKRADPCGLCVPCRTGRAAPLPPATPREPLPSGLDVAAVREVRSAHPDALGAPRQLARWLSGLTSPATTRAKLTRHPLFGALADRSFREVLAWSETER